MRTRVASDGALEGVHRDAIAMFSVLTGVPVTQLNTVVIRSQLQIFLVVQWLRLCAPNAEGTGSIPGWERVLEWGAIAFSNCLGFLCNGALVIPKLYFYSI